MDPNKCLPPELTVESVDDILYRIGLCFTSVRDRPKRQLIYHPFLVFSVVFIYMIKNIFTFSLTEDHELTFIVLGDFGFLLGARFELDLFFILTSILLLSSQMIYYNNYRNGIKPTFLRVFQMMSALIPPKSLGLTDEKHITKLVRTTRKVDRIIGINLKIIVVFAIIILPSLFLVKYQLFEAVCFGLPNSLLMTLWSYYFWSIFLFHFFCFYIICLYLKMKINSLNESLLEMQRRKRFIKIRENLKSMDSLYSEINEYDSTVWSKFLCFFWLTYGANIVLYIHIVITIDMELFMNIIIIYATLVITSTFVFLISTAASVNYCANKSYKTLNSLFISYSQYNQRNNNSKITTKLKVNNMIQRLGQRKVGFTCWLLFTINYYRFYEILGYLFLLFLKIMEMDRNFSN